MKTGTITSFRRKWPTLIRQAQRTTRLKFQRRPILQVEKRRGNLKGPGSSQLRPRKKHPYVFLPRTTIKKDGKVAREAALHELRELLYLQKYSRRQAHLRAKSKEPKNWAWVLRRHLQLKKGDGIVTKPGT